MLGVLTKSNFDPHLNDIFQVHTETVGVVDIQLVEITGKKTAVTEGFSLIFHGSKDKELGQRIYRITHPKMGEMELFLVPVTYHKTDGMYYQAVFNRLVEKKN